MTGGGNNSTPQNYIKNLNPENLIEFSVLYGVDTIVKARYSISTQFDRSSRLVG